MTDVTKENCMEFIEQFQCPHWGLSGYMTQRGFEMFLLDEIQDIFDYSHKKVYQDMTQPLSHYYIASSHNTYLRSNQLVGSSSVEPFINALKKGYRCLEIDIWDGPDNLPIVYHGHTLTSKILLSDVLDAIRDNAFVESSYPLILSLEVNCTAPQQVVIAQLVKSKLSDFLFDMDGKAEEVLPSPDKLQKQILISVEKLTLANDEEEEVKQKEDLEQDGNDEAHRYTKLREIFEPSEMASELADLVLQCPIQVKSFNSFEDCANWEACKMFSMSEIKAGKFLASSESNFTECLMRRLCRVYPRGARADSSNFVPIPLWNSGVQMAALNIQTYGLPMLLNEARFADNGKCGYVLKPEFLRNPEKKLDAERKTVVKVKIISGQKIPKPCQARQGEIVDPYVVVTVFGHPSDEQKKKTRFILNNGFNPVWNEEFEFIVKVPELAFFCFVVYDENHIGKDEILAQFALPFASMTEGYRHVHLVDSQGTQIVAGTLFLHISINKID